MEENRLDRALPYIKKWGYSVCMIVPCWIMSEQFWLALSQNVMLAARYPYPPVMNFFMFLLDNFDLIVHEAGHTFFSIFGIRFVTILGGSLFAFLLPVIIFVTAWFKRQRILAQFCLFWAGFSLFGSAAYCADAYNPVLPLIGNLGRESHDYLNMLSSLNILHRYMEVAWVIFGFGLLFLLAGLLYPLFEKKQYAHIDLSSSLVKSGLDV